jgi:short-chain fatty acids transporter
MLFCLPALMYFLGKLWPGEPGSKQLQEDRQATETRQLPNYLSLDKSPLSGIMTGSLLILYAGYLAIENASEQGLSFLDLNYINFLLLGFCLLLHGSLDRFSEAVQAAVGGASGIIIQFPLYAGIMGLIKYGGLVEIFSYFFLQISDARSLPVFTFLSAGLVNFFVPSGGGQWAVQGPIMLQAAESLQVAPEKVIMALAYGDGLTNMLQPFWALPLLGITRLQARDILPYTAILLLAGLLIYSAVLWFVW